jgi:transcriptional regulator with XRE-family HTH domain
VSATRYDLDALQEEIRLAPGQLIAARVKRARKTAGPDGTVVSHDRLAVTVGTSRQHLIKLENATHRPRAEMLLKIAEATGRDPRWFLDPEVDPSPFPHDADGDG